MYYVLCFVHTLLVVLLKLIYQPFISQKNRPLTWVISKVVGKNLGQY